MIDHQFHGSRQRTLRLCGIGGLAALLALGAAAAPPAPVAPLMTSAATRFTDPGDGTVTDRLTGLIWLKNANCFGTQTWSEALASANGLADGACDLMDSSVAGQWRLPSVHELESLINYTRWGPALPVDHPFAGVLSGTFWSSTTNASNTSLAWYVRLDVGVVFTDSKTGFYYVWPVRGGL